MPCRIARLFLTGTAVAPVLHTRARAAGRSGGCRQASSRDKGACGVGPWGSRADERSGDRRGRVYRRGEQSENRIKELKCDFAGCCADNSAPTNCICTVRVELQPVCAAAPSAAGGRIPQSSTDGSIAVDRPGSLKDGSSAGPAQICFMPSGRCRVRDRCAWTHEKWSQMESQPAITPIRGLKRGEIGTNPGTTPLASKQNRQQPPESDQLTHATIMVWPRPPGGVVRQWYNPERRSLELARLSGSHGSPL